MPARLVAMTMIKPRSNHYAHLLQHLPAISMVVDHRHVIRLILIGYNLECLIWEYYSPNPNPRLEKTGRCAPRLAAQKEGWTPFRARGCACPARV